MSFEIVKVIIKGEMPEKCNSCPKYDRWLGYCWLMSKMRDESHTRPDWCPLTTDDDYLSKRLDELTEEFEQDSKYIEPRPEREVK